MTEHDPLKHSAHGRNDYSESCPACRAARNRPRYERAKEVQRLMQANAIGIGDLDLLDMLEQIESEGRLRPITTVPLSYEAIVKDVPGEYQWHGNQDDFWAMLSEDVEGQLRQRKLIEDEDDEEVFGG